MFSTPSIENKLDVLRSRLYYQYDQQEINEIIDMARQDMLEMLNSISDQYLNDAISTAQNNNDFDVADEFYIDYNNQIKISTMSGQTDFTIPPTKMLPHFLKSNTKISKDGNAYKIIPVGGARTRSRSTVDALIEQNRSSKTDDPKFRVASSKQNPETQWVIPEQKRDYTDIINSININMNKDIEESLTSIISRYGG